MKGICSARVLAGEWKGSRSRVEHARFFVEKGVGWRDKTWEGGAVGTPSELIGVSLLLSGKNCQLDVGCHQQEVLEAVSHKKVRNDTEKGKDSEKDLGQRALEGFESKLFGSSESSGKNTSLWELLLEVGSWGAGQAWGSKAFLLGKKPVKQNRGAARDR